MAKKSLGKLVVDIEANVASLQKDMKKVDSELSKVRQSTKRTADVMNTIGRSINVFKNIGIAIAGVTAAAYTAKRAFDVFNQAFERADQIAKTADKVGLTTDALQELRFAADQTGVDVRTADMAFQRFSRRVGEVATGTGELLNTAKQYNIAVRDTNGNVKSNIDLLREFADVVKNAESDQERLRIAFKLFDSEGAKLVNLLRGGSGAIDQFRARAQELGVVINEDLLRGSVDTRDAINELTSSVRANLTTALISLAPQIEVIVKQFTDAAIAVGKFFDKISLRERFKNAFDDIKALSQVNDEFREKIQKALDLSTPIANLNGLRTTLQFTEEQIKTVLGLLAQAQGQTTTINTGQGQDQIAKNEELKRQRERELEIELFFINKKVEAEQEANERILQAQSEFVDIKNRLQQRAINNTIQLLQILGQKNKAFAIAAIAVEKGLAIARVVQDTAAGVQRANLIYGPGTPAALSAIAFTKSLGAANIALIAATGLAQAASVNSGGGGGVSGGGVSGGTTPVNQVPEIQPTDQGIGQTTIIFQGGTFVGGDKNQLARDLLPGIEQAIKDGARG